MPAYLKNSSCISSTAETFFLRIRQWLAKTVSSALLALPALVCTAGLASAEDRSLKLFFTHTGERATITYKRDGRYDSRGLAEINRFLRDWRRNEPARMDPRLLDLVWEVYDRSGAKDYIHIVSAYRSPATNNMLRGRSRSTGVAKNSQHMLGKAMDFYIPGVKLATLRALAMQAQVGGVGYYPTSGSPFVHLDVGNVRAWPRMSRQELARIFPDGKTMHLPADGRPLPGYDQAVADYRRRVGPNSIQIASAAGEGDDDDTARTPVRASILTAMLPSRKSRAEEALELQTKARAETIPPEQPEFVDLAALAVPVPSVRPSAAVPADAVETASLGPSSAPLEEPANPAPLPVLKQPSGGIALLPMSSPEPGGEYEDEVDMEESLVSWALSEPGSRGMIAPVLVQRSLSSSASATAAYDGGQTAVPTEAQFDGGRFWADG
ncbi:DUF882 domain-containing protein [Neorhizobium sp. NPDC001467]|uniref:DUF882 domain-containing protein n=1 Tax=Neorhizobium sp. NPDC001467 TaxID=3390595 RepID=UPI003D000556